MARNSEIYLKAFELIATAPDEYYSCDAIRNASNYVGNTADDYAALFCPIQDYGASCYWLGWNDKVINETEKHEWRLTALCFMAAIAADEETK